MERYVSCTSGYIIVVKSRAYLFKIFCLRFDLLIIPREQNKQMVGDSFVGINFPRHLGHTWTLGLYVFIDDLGLFIIYYYLSSP